MDSRYIQHRTDDILRQRIALGATGGARRKAPAKKRAPARRAPARKAPARRAPARKRASLSKRACPRSRPIRRRAYTRANGTRVASTCARRPRRRVGGEGFEEDFYGEFDIPVHRGGARRRSSPWIQHVKQYAAKHGVPYAVALMEASESYRG
jgi:hypothetical protein